MELMNVEIKYISYLYPKTVVAMCLLISCIFFSCNQSEQTHIDRLERQYIDSLVRSQRGIDSLEKYVIALLRKTILMVSWSLAGF